MPHGHCYLWKPPLVSLHVISDTVLFISFEIILAIFLYITYKSKDRIPYSWIFLALGGLFLLCGFTHLFEVWNLWNTNYWIGGFLKALTAIASIASVIAIIPMVPKILAVPTPTELLALNEKLKHTIEEKDKIHRTLTSKERIESFGVLSSGVAHEIKNPLHIIQNTSKSLKRDIQDYFVENKEHSMKEEQLLNHIDLSADKIIKNGDRTNTIIDNMFKHFQDDEEQVLERVNVNELVETSFYLCYHAMLSSIPPNVEIVFSLPHNPLFLNLFPHKLSQALVNIFSNSMYFMNIKYQKNLMYKSKIVIDLRVSKNKSKFIIEVTDNGIGVSKECVNKIFKPFYSTRPGGEGAGLGLAVSFDLVTLHEGEISVKSSEGEFTNIIISIPTGLI